MSRFELTAVSALKSDRPALDGAPCLILEERPDVVLCDVLARKNSGSALAAHVRAEFGLELPITPKYVSRDGVAFVWAGPGQWLALASGPARGAFQERLRASLKDAASIVDQSDGRTIVRISGARARDVLAKGVLIDLHPRTFQPGHTALTIISYINVHFWQLDAAPQYEVLVFRSFAAAFCDWLKEAAAEYGPVEIKT